MNRKLFGLVLMIVLLVPAIAGAVTTEDFEVATTHNLLNLCTANVDDPYYVAAIHFCHGYLVGAFAYYKAEYAGPDTTPLICFTDPPPSRNAAINMFIEWAKGHPEYMDDKPVETEFRFLFETWPCN